MKIERDGDVIHFHDEEEDVSGATARMVMVQTIDEEQAKRYWDYCAGLIQPGGHTVAEAIQWIEANWDLERLLPDDRHMINQRATIAENRCPEQYDQPDINPEMTDEEIEHQLKQGWARREEAEKKTDEQLGIRLRGYRVLYTARNQPLYDQAYEEFQKRMEEHRQYSKERPQGEARLTEPDIKKEKQKAEAYLFLEETEGQISGIGVGSGPLCRKLAEYIGVSKEDIETRSPRFMAYVLGLSQDGTVPSFPEFCEIEDKKK